MADGVRRRDVAAVAVDGDGDDAAGAKGVACGERKGSSRKGERAGAGAASKRRDPKGKGSVDSARDVLGACRAQALSAVLVHGTLYGAKASQRVSGWGEDAQRHCR